MKTKEQVAAQQITDLWFDTMQDMQVKLGYKRQPNLKPEWDKSVGVRILNIIVNAQPEP